MFEELDDLARGLAENEISRGQALRWAGYSLVGAALSSIGFADRAKALTRRQRRRCLERGGMVCGERPLANKYCCRSGKTCAGGNTCGKGCRNPGNCEISSTFPRCRNTPGCFCTGTVEGGTFCAQAAFRCD